MSAAGAIRLDTASFSHQGGREYNEDFLGECEATGDLRLFVLADGAGGHGGGDVAARTAVAAAQTAFCQSPVFSADTVLGCIRQADQAVTQRQQGGSRLARMACTLVLLLVSADRGQALFGSLGDSRCYVLRGATVRAQSQDHSLVQRYVDAGLLAPEKARGHPQRNVLYASLGANHEDTPPYLLENAIALEPGDGVLLCSDGVWELLEDARLGELHAGSSTVQVWRDRLADAVRQCMPAGHDNYSAILVRCLAAAPSGDDTIPPGTRPAWVAKA